MCYFSTNISFKIEKFNLALNREAIAREMKTVLDEGTEPWGVMVERVEVKDVRQSCNEDSSKIGSVKDLL